MTALKWMNDGKMVGKMEVVIDEFQILILGLGLLYFSKICLKHLIIFRIWLTRCSVEPRVYGE